MVSVPWRVPSSHRLTKESSVNYRMDKRDFHGDTKNFFLCITDSRWIKFEMPIREI